MRILQAQRAVCEYYHRWVLEDPEEAVQAEAEWPGAQDDDSVDYHGDQFLLPQDFPPLRPVQADALTIIHDISRRERRIATAAVITPTGSGKDLLPLALARALKGTSVLFVPFKHLVDSAVAYTRQFGGVAETFDTARVHNNSAADVVVCSFEHAEKAVCLLRNLFCENRLAGVIKNEAHVLARSLVSFRDFERCSCQPPCGILAKSWTFVVSLENLMPFWPCLPCEKMCPFNCSF